MFSTFASGEVQSKKLAARLKKDCGFTAPFSVDNLWLGKQDFRRQSADIFEGRDHNGSVPTPQRMYGVLRQVNHVLILIVLRLCLIKQLVH